MHDKALFGVMRSRAITYVRESLGHVTRLIHTCVTTHKYVWHNSFICVTWLIHMWDTTRMWMARPIDMCSCGYFSHQAEPLSHMRVTWLACTRGRTHSYVWYDSFICVTWLIHTCHMAHICVTANGWQQCTYVTWLIYMCDTTHSYVWHDSFIRVTWLIHTCDMTHSYVWHDSFIRVTWLIHTCDMTHSYVWHDSHALVAWLMYDSWICVFVAILNRAPFSCMCDILCKL